MVVILHTKQLFRLIEEIEVEPSSDKYKAKYMNRLDEAQDTCSPQSLEIFDSTSKK